MLNLMKNTTKDIEQIISISLPKLICYDWDNTLVDTNPISILSLNSLFEKYNLPLLKQEDMAVINGYNFDEWLHSLFSSYQPEKLKAIKAEYAEIYSDFSKDLKPLESALDTIKTISEYKIPQIIISNKFGSLVRQEAIKFGFADYFSLIIGPDDAKYAKPDKKMFDFAIQKLSIQDNFTNNDLWFFGDSTVDFYFSQNINAKLIFLNNLPDTVEYNPENVIFLQSHKDFKNIRFYN
jgi:phosphoglycolate phosphatase